MAESISWPILIALVGMFVSLAVLTGSVTGYFLAASSRQQQRLRQVGRESVRRVPDILSISLDEPAGHWARLERMLTNSDKERARLRTRLVRGGFRHPGAPVIYMLIERLGPLALGVVPFAFLSGTWAWVAGVLLGVLTFFAPGFMLERRMAARRRAIENGLPDALDLLVVCIEAGCSLDQAIVKASEELGLAYPALGEELRILITEIRAGKTRLEAFQGLAQRTKVEDIRSLVAMLVQTDRFGTSVGQALRTHADVSRVKRRQRAEEQAAKIGVKLVFPLVLFFFPALYVVVLGPAVIQFIRAFMK